MSLDLKKNFEIDHLKPSETVGDKYFDIKQQLLLKEYIALVYLYLSKLFRYFMEEKYNSR